MVLVALSLRYPSGARLGSQPLASFVRFPRFTFSDRASE